MSAPILHIRDLVTAFPSADGRVPVVDGVSLEVDEGEVLALVGESGCGKSMTALSAMRLIPKPGRLESGVIGLWRGAAGPASRQIFSGDGHRAARHRQAAKSRGGNPYSISTVIVGT